MHVKITGRLPELDQARLTKTTQTLLGFSSTDAERLTDLVLDGEPVELNVPDPTAAEYVRRITRLGVIAKVVAE